MKATESGSDAAIGVFTLLRRTAAMSLAAVLMVAGTAAATESVEITEVVVFGDSLSDTGNVFAATGNQVPASPPWFEGRFTNGFVWHEILTDGLGVASATPSLLGGNNFAWGGADYGAGFSPVGVPNVGTQIAEFLGTRTARDDQLFLINGGNNDFIPPGTPADPVALADTVVEHISTLAAAGARHFVVPTSLVSDTDSKPGLNPPLSSALFFPNEPTEAVIRDIRNRADRFNLILRRKLFLLERQLDRAYDQRVTITYANLALAARIVSRRPSRFGIDRLDLPAVDAGPFPPTCFCGGTAAPDADRFFYFDIVHPTATVHEIYGEVALSSVLVKLRRGLARR